MQPEYFILALGCILGLVHIFAAGQARTSQYGAAWNVGARDGEAPEPNAIVGRLTRAQANYFETFPIVIAVIAILGLAGLHSRWTELGADVWLVARIVYLPLYAAGVPVVRTIVFLVSVIGILMMLLPAFTAGIHGSLLF